MATRSSQPAGEWRGLVLLIVGGVAVGGLMAALTIGAAGMGLRSGQRPPTSIPDPVAVGQPAPDFAARTPSGEEIRLSSLRGSPVVLNFWATWCGPCRVEMPELQSASSRYADAGLVILGVNAGEPADVVEAYMDELNLTFDTILDPDGVVVDLYEVWAFPTTFWIDAGGIIRAEHLGPLTREFIDRY